MGKDAERSRERRRSRRIETSLPARFTADQQTYMHGVITSFGEAGLFLQSPELVARGTKVVIEAGLGSEVGEFRWVAKVAYVNRRAGTELVPGIGVSFDEPPASVRAQIADFLDRYPGAVPLDLEGRFAWPVPETLDGEEAGVVRVPLGERPFVNVAALQTLIDQLEASEAERVVLSFRERDLLPAEGLSRIALLEVLGHRLDEVSRPAPEPTFAEHEAVASDDVAHLLEEIEAEAMGEVDETSDEATSSEAAPQESSVPPQVEAEARSLREVIPEQLAAQCALVAAESAAEWRLELLVREPADFLAALDSFMRRSDELDVLAVEGSGDSELLVELARSISASVRRVEGHTEALAWHVDSTLELAEARRARARRSPEPEQPEQERVPDDLGVGRHYRWDRMRSGSRSSAGELMIGAVRDLLSGRATSTGAASSRALSDAKLPPWLEPALMVLAFLVLPLVGAGTWALPELELGEGPTLSRERLASMQVSPEGEGASRMELHAWADTDPRTDSYLSEQAKILAAGGFDSATFVYDGRAVAVWRDGYIARP